jgi:hypothetical protein
VRDQLVYFVSLIIVLILALSILLQQAQSYHKVIRDAKKFANRNSFKKKFWKRDKKNGSKVFREF